MFCSYCGTKNSEESIFCQNCGAKMLVASQKVAKNSLPLNTNSNRRYPAPQQNHKTITNTSGFTVATPYRSKMSAEVKKLYVTTLILHIITVILYFVPTLFSRAVTTDGEILTEETASMFDLFCNMTTGVAFIITILIFASAIITALPVLNIEGKKAPKLILPKIINILLMLWTIFYLLILLVSASDLTSDVDGYGFRASAGLNILGVIYLASIFILIIMLFVCTSKDER